MKKNIISIILAFFVIESTLGQELNVNKSNLQNSKVVLFEKNGGDELEKWSIVNDTVTIESEKALAFGKVRHDSQKQIKNFVVSENGNIIINEKSKNCTDNTLTVKPGCVYDFYKADTLFLTIVVKNPVEEQKSCVPEDKVDDYENGEIDNQQKQSPQERLSHWLPIVAATVFVLFVIVGLTVGILLLWRIVKSKNCTLTEVEEKLAKVKENLGRLASVLGNKDVNEGSTTENTEETKDVSNEEGAVDTHTDQQQNESESWLESLTGKLRMTHEFDDIFKYIFEYENTIGTDITKLQNEKNEIEEQLKGVTTAFESKRTQLDNIENLINPKVEGASDSFNESSVEFEKIIIELKEKAEHYQDILSILKIDDCNNDSYNKAEEKVNYLLLLEQNDNKADEEKDKDKDKEENSAISEYQVNAERWKKVEFFLKEKGKLINPKPEDILIDDLKVFYDANYFRNILNNKNDYRQTTLNCYILDKLDEQAKDLFPDAKGNSKKWIDYLKDKFEEKDQSSAIQKKAIIEEAVSDALTNDTSKSLILKELIKKLISLLNHESDKEKLIGDNVMLQSIADLLNSIPRTEEETKQKDCEEVLLKLQEALHKKDPINLNSMQDAIQQYYDKRVSEEIENILQREDVQNKMSAEIDMAKVGAEKDTLVKLQNILAEISTEVGVQMVCMQGGIPIDGIKPAIDSVYRLWYKTKNDENFNKRKSKLLDNDKLNEICADIIECTSDTSLYNMLAETIVKTEREKQNALEKAEADKQDALIKAEENKRKELEKVESEKQEALRKLEIEKQNVSKVKAEKEEVLQAVEKKMHEEIKKIEKEKQNALEKAEADKQVALKNAEEKKRKELEKVESEKQDALREVELEKQNVSKVKTEKEVALKNAEMDKQKALYEAEKKKADALDIQKKELDAIIQKEKGERKQDNLRWSQINEINETKIKEYHLAELTRIKISVNTIDEQLKAAYTNYDRNTPLGKLIDSFIRSNTFYSLEKFLTKVESIGSNPTEKASELSDSMRHLYKECLSLRPPTWVDVLTRLYCYTNVPFIADTFEKVGLNCQAIRRSFFQVEYLLRETGITIIYPQLFKDKLTEDYEVKPERNIDNYVSDMADHIPDRKTIIDLYTVGFKIVNEEARKPVVSTY